MIVKPTPISGTQVITVGDNFILADGLKKNTTMYTYQEEIKKSIAASSYAFTFDSSSQVVNIANTFQSITFNNANTILGWTYSNGTFTCDQSGVYLFNYDIQVSISLVSGVASAIVTQNGEEILGSQSSDNVSTLSVGSLHRSFINQFFAGDLICLKFTGDSTNISTSTRGSGNTLVSASLKTNVMYYTS